MRELVVNYLQKRISRRGFVGGLTKAGVTLTAAQGVLASVNSVSLAQTGPAAPPAAEAAGGAAATVGQASVDRPGHIVPGHWRRGLCRAAYRLRREIRLRQLRQRRCRVLRGARRPPAAQIHPDAARGTRRRHGRRLREGVGRADDRDAGRRGRHGECHRPDVQRLQGADAARRLLLPHRPDRSRRSRRLRGGAEPGADRSADHEVHLARAPRRHDPGDDPPRVQGIAHAADGAVLHLVAFRLQPHARPHRHHQSGSVRSAHAGAAQSGRGRARRQAPGRGEAADPACRRRDLPGQGGCRRPSSSPSCSACRWFSRGRCTPTSRRRIRCGAATCRPER